MNILLLEDNIQLAESIGEYLEGRGCYLDYAYTAQSCLNLIAHNQYDVLVFDIAMSGMSGLEACIQVRQHLQISTPLIFLTARDTLEDKLEGYKSGCDDYLVKPFAPEELFCRIESLVNRGPRRDLGQQELGPITINHANRQVVREGQRLTLHKTQFDILKLLIQHHPNIVSKEAIERTLWGDSPPDSDSLRTHIFRLRGVLDKPFAKPIIKNIHAKGYQLDIDE